MNMNFVKAFEAGKADLREEFEGKFPDNYTAIVTAVVRTIADNTDRDTRLDPDAIHVINDGDYQGTLLFVIAEDDYQPNRYWFVMVDYGSCSGCDTLEGLRPFGDETADERSAAIDGLMTLALHIVQRLKPLGEEVG